MSGAIKVQGTREQQDPVGSNGSTTDHYRMFHVNLAASCTNTQHCSHMPTLISVVYHVWYNFTSGHVDEGCLR